jgi:hypothetical protein
MRIILEKMPQRNNKAQKVGMFLELFLLFGVIPICWYANMPTCQHANTLENKQLANKNWRIKTNQGLNGG